MQERSDNFDNVDDASDITLAAPRFDANEAERAHPVVPLEAVRRAHTDDAKPRMMSRRFARRSWPLGLMVAALLAVVTAGGIATKVLRRERSTQPAQDASSAAPASSLNASAATQTDAARNSAASDARVNASASRKARQSRAFTAPQPEQDETLLLPKEIVRRVTEASGEDDEVRRGHGREKKKHHGGDEEKDFRKELKRAKKNAPRLVDMLIGPR